MATVFMICRTVKGTEVQEGYCGPSDQDIEYSFRMLDENWFDLNNEPEKELIDAATTWEEVTSCSIVMHDLSSKVVHEGPEYVYWIMALED
jgi:hypothetical protein